MKSEKYLSMAKDIRSKVEDLLDEYNTFEPSISKMFLDGQPLYEQAIKFTHLVYSFDPNLPLTYIIHSGFISGYQNRYGDNLKPPTNVYHRMTA